MAGGVQASLKILQRSDRRVLQLRRNLDFFCDHLGIERRRFPVVSVESTDATKLIDCLIRSGIHPPFIRYPGGAEGGIFRFFDFISTQADGTETFGGRIVSRALCD